MVNRLHAWWVTLPTRWALPTLIAVAVVYFTAITLMHTQATSPIDEWVYLDYLVKIPTQGIVVNGELVGPQTLSLMSCHGTSPFGPIGTACGLTPNPLDYPNDGKTTASAYTPLYFYATFAWGWVLHHILFIPELVAWRLSSVAWAVAAVLIVVRLLRAWGTSESVIVVLGLVWLASPFSYWTFTYVSTDAPVVFFGALLALLATRYVRGEVRAWPLIVASLVAVAVKSTLIVGVAGAAVYLVAELIARAVRRRRERSDVALPWRWVVTAAGSVVGSVALMWAWNRLTYAMAISGSATDQGIATPLTPAEFLTQFTNFLPNMLVGSPIDAYAPTWIFAPLTWLAVTAVIGAALVVSRDTDRTPVVAATLTSVMVSAPALALMIVLGSGSYYQLPGRYGIALLPFVLVCGGFLLRNRPMKIVVAAYAGLLMAISVWLAWYLGTLAP